MAAERSDHDASAQIRIARRHFMELPRENDRRPRAGYFTRFAEAARFFNGPRATSNERYHLALLSGRRQEAPSKPCKLKELAPRGYQGGYLDRYSDMIIPTEKQPELESVQTYSSRRAAYRRLITDGERSNRSSILTHL